MMPKLSDAKDSGLVKVLLIGDSGTGKTGSLGSLVGAGYKLHILDFDNKIAGGILPQIVQKNWPDKIGNVDYESLRDNMKSSSLGMILDGQPRAFVRGLELLDKWSDGTAPKTWGPEHILVLDSLTFFSDAAFNWAKAMNPSAKDPRQWFYSAQSAVEDVLSALSASSMQTNVIIISHVSWVNRPDGTMKGYPSSVGQALGPTIPAYFENMAQCQSVAGKRTITTIPTVMIDNKNPAAFKMPPALPIETGLADFFKTLRG